MEHRFSIRPLLALLPAFLLLAGCETSSISNSGYAGGRHWGGSTYGGELSEFDVLGIERGKSASDTAIADALDRSHRIQLRSGEKILLIQSGAVQPDGALAEAFGRRFDPVPFNGCRDANDGASFARSLRLAAAQSGCAHIVCVWGILESGEESYGTRPVSWVPIVGWVLPEGKKHMRITLKTAVLAVRDGSWTSTMTPALTDAGVQGFLSREKNHVELVAKLKAQAYDAAADDIAKLSGH
jgi:hypothetical protein